MGNLKVLHTEKSDIRQETKNILEEALSLEFDSVLIIGINDDGVHLQQSKSIDTLKAIGMIEAAKLQLWSEWE